MDHQLIGLMGNAKGILTFIVDRLDKMKLAESIVPRIKESVQYLQSTIKKIEPFLKKDSDIKEIQHFLTHLDNAAKSCSDISKEHLVEKFINAGNVRKLETVEAEIKMANFKLLLFMAANHLAFIDFQNDKLDKIDDFQSKKLDKVVALQQNSMAGLSMIKDKSIRRPPAPLGFNIQESKNKFILSWKPSGGIVDKYEICYNEHDDCSFPVDSECTDVEIESPWVKPGNIYAMKIRGVNKGGKGEWSNTVIGQFTKPFPQKPEISDLFLLSTIAVVTVKIPGAICSTESAVTCVETSYVSATSSKLSSIKFTIEPAIESSTYVFSIKKLCPDCRYNFAVKTENAEGWSKPSNFREGNTIPLPPIPTKPWPPIIKASTPTKVTLQVWVPENTCSKKSPIIAWKLYGHVTDTREEIIKYYPQDENNFTKKSITLDAANLNPSKKYTLQVMAQNENGWSEPSDKFEIHNAKPSTPKNVRVSSNRTHSQIKIRWTAPDSALITHYEIMRTTTKDNYSNVKPVKAPANKFSATFTENLMTIHIITLKCVLAMGLMPVIGVKRLKLIHEYTKALK